MSEPGERERCYCGAALVETAGGEGLACERDNTHRERALHSPVLRNSAAPQCDDCVQPWPCATARAVAALADEWDGGAEAGRARIMACVVHPCPRCVAAEAAIDLRATIGSPALSPAAADQPPKA